MNIDMVDYKEILYDLVGYFNTLAEDPLRKLKGSFKVQEAYKSSITSKGQEEILSLSLVYEDVDKYIPIRSSYILKNGYSEEILNKNKAYRLFYKTILEYMLFAKNNTEQNFIDLQGNAVSVIPLGELLQEGFNQSDYKH